MKGNGIIRVLRSKKQECFWLSIVLLYMLYYLPMPEELHSYCITPYILRYDLGFISRGLIGSFWGMIFPNITVNKIWAIIGLNQILLCLLTVGFLSVIKRHSSETTDKAVLFLALIFLVNPSSISFLFYWGNYGRMDLFMIAGTIISAILVIKEKYLILIPFICVAEMMIHQGFTFSYFPCILLMLVFYAVQRKRGFVIFIITLISGCVSFLYFQFWGKIDGLTLEETLNILASRTDWPIESMSSMVQLEYYTNIFDFIPVYVLPFVKMNLIKIALVALLLLPMEYLVFKIWREFVGYSKNKWYWSFPAFIVVATLPKFLITCDYGRDLASIFISQFILIFAFFAMGNRAMKEAVAGIQKFIIHHPVVAIFTIVELSSIGKFEAANILDISSNIYSVLEKLFLLGQTT